MCDHPTLKSIQFVLVGRACVGGGCAVRGWEGATRCMDGCGPGTYSNERQCVCRIDSDGTWLGELGDFVVVAIVDALNARAGERDYLVLAREIDLPDAVIVSVLRCV